MTGLSDSAGQIIGGRYQLLEPIGQGSSAVVWRARCKPPSTRLVAVKRLLPAFERRPEARGRLLEEGRVGQALGAHPNLVGVIECAADPEGRCYLVMELVEGLDLGRLLIHQRQAQRRLPWPVVAHLGREVLAALTFAHERVDARQKAAPVHHRELGVRSVLLGCDGTLGVGGFGADRARPASVQDDLAGVGAVLWATLSDQPVLDRWLPQLGRLRPDLPEGLVEAVTAALRPTPEARFESAREMSAALDRALMSRLQRVAPGTVGRLVDEAREALGLATRSLMAAVPGVPPAAAPAPPFDPEQSMDAELTEEALPLERKLTESQRLRALADFGESSREFTVSPGLDADTVTQAQAYTGEAVTVRLERGQGSLQRGELASLLCAATNLDLSRASELVGRLRAGIPGQVRFDSRLQAQRFAMAAGRLGVTARVDED